MENKKKFLKFLWIPGIGCMPLVLCLAFACYMAWKECRINSVLVEESLRGNNHAIAILAKYEKPWKLDERIVYAAMHGNPHALEVLKIDNVPNAQ